MWIMLIHTTASARSTGHGASTSSGSGARRLARPASSRQAVMLARESGSGSVGCHCSAGKARAKYTACSPVPAATSSTRPAGGSTPASTWRIGSRLRSVAGASFFMRAP
jgi:hypothetical protein